MKVRSCLVLLPVISILFMRRKLGISSAVRSIMFYYGMVYLFRLFWRYLYIAPAIRTATIHRFWARKARPFAPQLRIVLMRFRMGTRIGSADFASPPSAFPTALSHLEALTMVFFPATTTVVIIPAIEMAMSASAPRFSFAHLRKLSNFVRMSSLTFSLSMCFLSSVSGC